MPNFPALFPRYFNAGPSRAVQYSLRLRGGVYLGSQISNSRPDPAFSVSFLELSWFEWRKISNGSNRTVCPVFLAKLHQCQAGVCSVEAIVSRSVVVRTKDTEEEPDNSR